MNMKVFVIGAAAVASLLSAAPVRAADIAPGVDFTSAGETNGNCCWTLGYEFTANRDAIVLGLATWDSWNSTGSVDVGLWDGSGNLIAQAAVSDKSPAIGSAHWSFNFIAPVALTPGDTYYVGSYGRAANYAWYTGGFTVNPRINFVEDSWQYGAFGLPAASDHLNGFFGGNVILAVPEASTWAMMGLGFAGLALAGHRSRRSAAAIA